ncbi:RnfH family protein [Pseudohongiella spirulinae]|uniref:UPF0125 protein PS2015_2506 n=1 Tax=Pseudohongiella spirulinae TaxID=1249552 RepID=A0A0S2KGH7_9GAMM|nr:RnfH family protein [Pseudohongiella spirulinae]ALO47140.1 RnfH [Pseudohongiella spirulinae]
MAEMMDICVVYARPDTQQQVNLQLPPGSTAQQALQASGLLEQWPEIDLRKNRIGVHARILDGRVNPSPEHYVLQHLDRVEIYRPLQIDPKQARLLRAERAKARHKRVQENHESE